MQDLRLVGVHEDGTHLLLSDAEGGRYRVPLDEPLRAAARRDRARLGQLQIEIDGGLRPRDIQALIRAGASAEEVADRSGWSVEKVRRYEGPILAEREHVAGLARTVRLRSRGGASGAPTLASRVGHRLAGRGVDPAAAVWDSARDEDGHWTVVVTFPAGGRQRQARWLFDVPARTVSAADDEARWLSEDDSTGETSPVPAPHLVSAPVRSTTVYDVEAEGGVAAAPRRPSASPVGGHEEPLDLMTAMRERASARGRRGGGRRRSAPAASGPGSPTGAGSRPASGPGAGTPPEDALPLEHIAYDPETMPPPPAARGTHPADEPPSRADDGPAGGEDVLPALEQPSTEASVATQESVATGGSPAPSHEVPSLSTSAPDVPARAGSDEPAAPEGRPGAPDPSSDTREADDAAPAADAPSGPGSGDGTPGDEDSGSQPSPRESTDRPAKPRPARKGGRPSVPSWDDVMFGARPSRD